MFDAFRARRAARRAAEQQQKADDTARAAKQQQDLQRQFFADALDLARSYHGEPSTDLVLKPGEAVYASVKDASLIEDRAGRGHWQGGSQGVSIPIGSLGGRSIRYHVGATRGHYEQGTPVATAIDTGTLFVTNRRVVFRGLKQNRECLFDKLLGVEHHDGESIFAVSNRQKNTVVHYGAALDGWFQLRFEIAFADHQGTRDALVAELAAHVAELDRAQPELPGPPAAIPASSGVPATETVPPAAAEPATNPAAVLPPPPAPDMAGRPADWARDPTGRHEYRWWDGTAWTDAVADQGVTATDPPD